LTFYEGALFDILPILNIYGIDLNMKQYVIDELRPADYQKIKDYLDTHFGPAEMKDIYWIPLDPELYDREQSAHKDCHPLYFSIHLNPESIVGELMVRTKNRIRCDCIRYADDAQLNWFISFVDSIFTRLEIKT
jgi:hypothetical protein